MHHWGGRERGREGEGGEGGEGGGGELEKTSIHCSFQG